MSRATPIMVAILFSLASLVSFAAVRAEDKPNNTASGEKPAAEAPAPPAPGTEPPAAQPGDKPPAGEKPSQAKPGDEKSAPAKPGAEKDPAAKPDLFLVPDAPPKELIQYIKKLLPAPIHSAAERTKKLQALNKAVDKILAGKPEEADLDYTVQLKLRLIEDHKKWLEFAEQLKKDGRGKQARFVRGAHTQVELGLAARGGLTKLKKAIAESIKFLEEEPPQLSDVNVAGIAGQLAENTHDNHLAAETYRAAAKALSASKDAKVLEYAKQFEGMARYFDLPGNEIKIEGKLTDGTPFDWSQYAGKVVLVNFWTSWDGNCVADISKLLKLHDAYRAKGFEIVGVSCDHRAADLQKYLKEKKLPWAVVYGGDKPGPTPAYYGIRKVPNNILVGRDGKVITLEARGLKLKEELAKLFGPLEEPKTPGAPAPR